MPHDSNPCTADGSVSPLRKSANAVHFSVKGGGRFIEAFQKMFANLISALQGDAPVDEEDGGVEETGETSQARAEGESGGFSLWGVASAITSTLQQTADEIVSSVQETDWKSELAMFGQAVQDDTVELGAKTVKAVEQLPEAGINIPGFNHPEVQQHLEGVGSSLTEFGKNLMANTREMLEQERVRSLRSGLLGIRDFVVHAIDTIENEMDTALKASSSSAPSSKQSSQQSTAKYSRIDSEVSAMQRDSSTYCDEPEDEEDFLEWKEEFSLADKEPDINKLISENAFMAELQSRIVPLIVEYDVFWTRYFYRLHKLHEKHEQRQQLAERATKFHEEEEQVSWDDDYNVDDESETEPVQETQQELPKTTQSSQNPEENEKNEELKAAAEATPKEGVSKVEVREISKGVGELGMESGEGVGAEAEEKPEGRSAGAGETGWASDGSDEDSEVEDELPVSTTPDEAKEDKKTDEFVATIPVIPEGCSIEVPGGGNGASPSGRNSDSIEMDSVSDGSGNREWCVVTSPKDKNKQRSALSKPVSSTDIDVDELDIPDDDDDIDEDWGNWE